MVVCPYCGKENNQPDASYCLYCGSSLRQQPASTFASVNQPSGQGFGTSSGMSSPQMSERYQKALARVEQLGNLVLALAVIALILFFV